jgi:hypothetical protein
MNERTENTGKDLKSALSWAIVGAKHVSSLVGLLSGLAGAVKLLQSFRGKDTLSSIRGPRRAPAGLLGSLALVGAGVAVGTGIGLFLAPASGAKTLRKIRRRIDEITGDEDRTFERDRSASPMKGAKNGSASAHHSAS